MTRARSTRRSQSKEKLTSRNNDSEQHRRPSRHRSRSRGRSQTRTRVDNVSPSESVMNKAKSIIKPSKIIGSDLDRTFYGELNLCKAYPYLLSKDELCKRYCWCSRITYNYIFTSYRKPTNSRMTCLYSLFTVHNELVNSWTHIIASLVAAIGTIYTILSSSSLEKTIVFGIYGACATFMFYSSSCYHIFCCHSDHFLRRVQCMDWLGITIMTSGTNLVTAYEELYKRGLPIACVVIIVLNLVCGAFTYGVTYSALQAVYHSQDTAAFKKELQMRGIQGGGGNDVLLTNKGKEIYNDDRGMGKVEKVEKVGKVGKGEGEDGVDEAKAKSQLRNLFESYAFRTIVAVSHAFMSLFSWLLGCHLTGVMNDHLPILIILYSCLSVVVLCLLDWPEKLLPQGTVDVVGASHQIFHLGIIAGVFGLWWVFGF